MFSGLSVFLSQKTNENLFRESLKSSCFFKFLARVREFQFFRFSAETDSFRVFSNNMVTLFSNLPKIDDIEELFVENQMRNYKR